MRHVLTTAAALLLLSACGSNEPESPTGAAASEPEFRELPGMNNWVMIIPSTLAADQWRAAARAKCGAAEFCQVFGWTDPAEAAQALPMTDRELKAQAFSLSINRTSGNDQTLFDCTRFPRDDRSECGAFGGDAVL